MEKSVLTKLNKVAPLDSRTVFVPQQKFLLGWPTEDDPRTLLPDFILAESKLDCWCNAANYAGGDPWYESAKRYKPGRVVTVRIVRVNNGVVDVELPNGILGEVYLSQPMPELINNQQKTARVIINNPFQQRLVLQFQSAVRISYLSSHCMSGLVTQIERDIPSIRLRAYKVTDVVMEENVLNELGEDAFVSLAHIWQLLVHQGNGQEAGILQLREKPNNFFVKDGKQQIWSIRLMWVNYNYDGLDRGWEILALPHHSNSFLEKGSMFFAQEHSF